MIMALLAFLLLAGEVHAATLYVNNSGSPACSDGTVKASNSSGSPWCTLGRAVWGNAVRASANASEAATAGDTVLVTAGVYSAAGTADRWDMAFSPVNTGTAGNYLTIQAVGTVELRLSSSTGPVIGCDQNKAYLKWVGFTIDEANAIPADDTGPVVLHAGAGCWVDRVTVHGNGGGHGVATNHNAFRIEACDGCRLTNSVAHNISTTAPANVSNGACVMQYESDDVVIEHNEFYDCGSGVFIKGPNAIRSLRTVIRENIIRDNTIGVILAAAEDAQVVQNLLLNNDQGLRLWDLTTDARATNCAVFSNTIYGGIEEGILVRSSLHVNVHFQNNLVTNGGNAWDTYSYANPGSVTSDRNHYFGATNFATTSGGNMTFATWQSTFSLDTNSVVSDPLFANVAGSNYRLCTGSGTPHASCSGASPALTTGRAYNNTCGTTGATIPAGAYCTGNETIGVEVASAGTAMISGSASFTGSVRIQ